MFVFSPRAWGGAPPADGALGDCICRWCQKSPLSLEYRSVLHLLRSRTSQELSVDKQMLQKRQQILHQGLQSQLQGSSFSADTNQKGGKRDMLMWSKSCVREQRGSRCQDFTSGQPVSGIISLYNKFMGAVAAHGALKAIYSMYRWFPFHFWSLSTPGCCITRL